MVELPRKPPQPISDTRPADQPDADQNTREQRQAQIRRGDLRYIDQISLSDDRDCSKMRLIRSQRYRAVWIQFDENPGKSVTRRLTEAGYRWEHKAEVSGHLGAWMKPLESGYEASLMLEAERLFEGIGNQIRQNKGLEPVGMLGRGAS